jgi:hypothetical protein
MMPKFKISRPILYILVLGAVAYAIVILTEPDTPARKAARKATTSTSKSLGGEGITAEDLKAHFPPYTSLHKDAFQPLILGKKSKPKNLEPRPTPDPKPIVITVKPPLPLDWNLTGITLTNGVRMALLENTSKTETIFLKEGDSWHGMQVKRIDADQVVLIQSDGNPYRMVFAAPTEIKPTTTVPPNTNSTGGTNTNLTNVPNNRTNNTGTRS